MERVCFVFFIACMQNFQASWYEYSRRPPQVRTARPDEGIFIQPYERDCISDFVVLQRGRPDPEGGGESQSGERGRCGGVCTKKQTKTRDKMIFIRRLTNGAGWAQGYTTLSTPLYGRGFTRRASRRSLPRHSARRPQRAPPRARCACVTSCPGSPRAYRASCCPGAAAPPPSPRRPPPWPPLQRLRTTRPRRTRLVRVG